AGIGRRPLVTRGPRRLPVGDRHQPRFQRRRRRQHPHRVLRRGRGIGVMADTNKLEAIEGGTLVTSYYDWSSIDQTWKDAAIFPIIPESALRATLGIMAR